MWPWFKQNLPPPFCHAPTFFEFGLFTSFLAHFQSAWAPCHVLFCRFLDRVTLEIARIYSPPCPPFMLEPFLRWLSHECVRPCRSEAWLSAQTVQIIRTAPYVCIILCSMWKAHCWYPLANIVLSAYAKAQLQELVRYSTSSFLTFLAHVYGYQHLKISSPTKSKTRFHFDEQEWGVPSSIARTCKWLQCSEDTSSTFSGITHDKYSRGGWEEV